MTRPLLNRPWTPEEDARLRTLLEDGKSTTLVSAKLNRTVAAVKGRAGIIGISLRRAKPMVKEDGKP